jgi:hypothetical protein
MMSQVGALVLPAVALHEAESGCLGLVEVSWVSHSRSLRWASEELGLAQNQANW